MIGPKIARELLEKFGTLDNLLEHIDEVAGKKRQENLREHREQALLSRQLVRLESANAGAHRLAARPAGAIRSGPRRRIVRGVRLSQPDVENARPGGRGSARSRADFDGVSKRSTRPSGCAGSSSRCRGNRRFLSTPKRPASRRAGPSWSACRSLGPMARAITCRCAARPVRNCSTCSETLAALRPVLENPAIRKIGQNLKYDLIVLRAAGVEVAGVAFDSMLASYLLDAGERNHNLDELAVRYLNHTTTKITELIGTRQESKADG